MSRLPYAGHTITAWTCHDGRSGVPAWTSLLRALTRCATKFANAAPGPRRGDDLVAAFAVNTAATETRRQAEIRDELFCTLTGVDPLDKAPGTGRRCITVLDD